MSIIVTLACTCVFDKARVHTSEFDTFLCVEYIGRLTRCNQDQVKDIIRQWEQHLNRDMTVPTTVAAADRVD